VLKHPDAGSHESSVQTLPSSQFGGSPPVHTPATHMSPVVQALPSSHGTAMLTWRQPPRLSHESAVQTLPSSQLGAVPPTHDPAAQVSLVVHALPSSHGAVFGVLTHPVAGLHESSVQPLESLQFGGGPPTQAPMLQVSLVVHALPSSQGAVLGVATHPVAASQVSVVQTSPSSQLGGGPPTHTPPTQMSFVVQALPSSQAEELGLLVQPTAGSQVSVVQTLPSSQLGAGPPTHAPAEQVSAVVHGLPSSHETVLGTLEHPDAGSQVSSVQTLPSSQFGGSPPTQAPALHASPVVHASPSSHGTATLA